MRSQHGTGGWPAGACDQTCAFIHNVGLRQACIRNGLRHRDMRISGARPHKAQGAFIDMFGHINFQRARDMAAKPALGHIRVEFNPRLPRFQSCGNLLGIIPDG